MNKEEFEASDGGIKAGDIVAITVLGRMPIDRDTISESVLAYTGEYDPVEDRNHWYLVGNQLPADLVDNSYVLKKGHTFRPDKPEYGIHQGGTTSIVHWRYESTLGVKRIMSGQDWENFIVESAKRLSR